MVNIKYIVLSISLLLVAGRLEAQSLEDYMAKAAAENPELQARFYNYHAALEKLPQVSSLPDPQMMIGYFIEPVRSRAGDFNFNASLAQQFPWFGLLKARQDVAAKQAEAKLQAFKTLRNEIFFAVKTNWYKLYELEERIRITKENLELLNYMEKLTLKQYETGKAQMVDVLRVQMQIKELGNELNKVIKDRSPLLARFNELVNYPSERKVDIPQALPLNEDLSSFSLDSVFYQNPKFLQLQASEQATEKSLKVAELSAYPTFNVGVNYTSVNAITTNDMLPDYNGRDVVQPFVGISLPVYRKKYKAMQKEADFRLKQVQQQKTALRNELLTAFAESRNELEDAQSDVELFKELVAQSEQALKLLNRSFSTADSDFEEVLQMQRQHLRYQLALIRAKVRQNIAVSKLEMLSASI